MNGWAAVAFPDLKIFHHRPSAVRGKMMKDAFRVGRMDHSFGSYPAFEILKCLRRFSDARFTGGMIRMCGFVWGYVCGEQRPVSDEFVSFLRNEQKKRVAAFFKNRFRWKHESVEAR